MSLHDRSGAPRGLGRSGPIYLWSCAAIAAVMLACGGGSSSGPEPGGGTDAGVDSGSPAGTDSGTGIAWIPIDVSDSTIESLRFYNDQTAFLAASDGVWKGFHVSADGGATWQARELDVAPYGIGFSPSLGTVLVSGSGPRALWRSTDRGASFAPVAWGQSGWPSAVRFLDEQTVFMGDEVGDRVFRSADAGQTWTTHSFTREVLPGTSTIEARGNHAWIVGGPAFNGDGTGATIAYSSDGALTWTITTLQDQAHLFKGGELHAIAVVSDSELWVAGENRQVYHTTDGMQSWTQIKGIPSDFLHFDGVAVRGDTVVLAGSTVENGMVFGYGLYRSTDGGHSFEVIDNRASTYLPDANGVHGVAQNTKGDLFVFGYDGFLWQYPGVMLGKG